MVGGYLRGEKGEGGRGKSYGKGMQSPTKDQKFNDKSHVD